MVRRLTAVIAVLTLLATGAACGGDDDGGGGEALTEAEWQEQADKICADHDQAIEEAEPDIDDPTPEDVEEYLDDVVAPEIEEQIEEIGDLNPPEEIQDDVDAMLDAATEALAGLEDLSGEELMALEDDPFAEVTELAAELGLEDCAE